MIEELVPATVTVVATRADLGTELFADELRALGSAVHSRRREFETGRACARRALAELGLREAVAVGSGTRGEPLWPAGVVGSITHCARYRACAVARDHDVLAVGIDAELDAPLPAGVLATIASRVEQRALAAHGAGACWDRVLFSAKEAVFKAWYPLTGQALAFEDADVRIDPDHGTFTARLLVDGPLRELHGRWAVAGGIVATSVAVAR
ncbi:MAG TPA: 4'-phosphopantetheinyl transferase superfamily protein [Solirubrobacteraceae bacterium]|nr:4'-phosphopantetheinyl transferase superfamily protein [Solirubrobacteraceae bacterium]